MKKVLVTLPVEQRHKDYLEAQANNCEFLYMKGKDVTPDILSEIQVLIGNLPPEQMKAAKKLEWVQLNSAGADNYTGPGILPEGAKLTNATGAYGLAISEHMLGMLLMLMKKLNLYHKNQLDRCWKDEGQVTSIYGSTTLILGFGDIGQEFGKRMHALGSHVIGIRRNKGKVPEFAEAVYTMEELEDVLPKADIIAMSLPNTPETTHIMNQKTFSLMKPGAILLNVGRGSSIDQEALLEALCEGRIGGAAVDVTDPEPLPEDSPLWKAPNMIITPHISGQFHLPETFERIVRIAGTNLAHFCRGEELINNVDFATGYRKFIS